MNNKDGKDVRCLSVQSPDLNDFFNSFSDTIRQKRSFSPFAEELYDKIGLYQFVRDMQSLTAEIPLVHDRYSYQMTNCLKPGAVFALEVQVTHEKEGLKVNKKNDVFQDTFFELKSNYHPRVILVSSSFIPVVDAKLKVYREYIEVEGNKSQGDIFIHHDYDDNAEIAQLSALTKISFMCDKVKSIECGIPEGTLQKLVHDQIYYMFSHESNEGVLNECYNVFLRKRKKDIGTVESGSYFCRSKESLNQLWQMLVEKTIQKTCNCLGYLIYRAVKCQRFENVAFTGILTGTMHSPIYENMIFKAMKDHIFDKLEESKGKHVSRTEAMSTNVNSKEWRKTVAEAICITVIDWKETLVDSFVQMRMEVQRDLDSLGTLLEDFKNRRRSASMFDLVEEWKKREIIPNRKQIMESYPSVLTYIVGRKCGKPAVKVFLKNDDNDAKRFFSQQSYETVIQIVHDIIRENHQTRSKAPSMDKTIRKRLGEIIKKQSRKLMATHSHIVRISEGNMLHGAHRGKPCIVLYCLDKTLIPFGEKELPGTLEGYPVDVREDFIIFGICDRCFPLSNYCSIGMSDIKIAGSIGFFAKLKKAGSPTIEMGFLTAAHVAYQGYSDLFEGTLATVHDVRRRSYEIVHPSFKDSSSPEIIGRVNEVIFGNHREIGIDAAFVQMYEENRGQLIQHIAEEEDLTCDGTTLVTKTGSTTSTTWGRLATVHNVVKIVFQNEEYVFEHLYSIENLATPQPAFFAPGDSGSGVFIVGKNGRCEKALGIGIALGTQSEETFVCSIGEIVKAFEIDIPQRRSRSRRCVIM